MMLRVFRKERDAAPSYQPYEIEATPGMTVLSALFQIQDRIDDTLAFRYSCRGAVCGSCAVNIGGIPRLACRTRLAQFESVGELIVEPLPNLPVLKDLVVDMDPFFSRYRRLRPWLLRAGADAESVRANRMDPARVRELEQFTNCVLCAACHGACPVNAVDPDYLGPAPLAKAYRFATDPRDADGLRRIAEADRPEGWRACEFHLKCRDVCPKGVAPNVAIGKARALLNKEAKG